MKKPSIHELEEAARKENWGFVDENLPLVAKDPDYVSWAYNEGIKNPDSNIRDLGASLLEKAEIAPPQFETMKPALINVMRIDRNNYAGFRAACALAAHGVYTLRVKTMLEKFSADKDVANIARAYLEKIDQSKL